MSRWLGLLFALLFFSFILQNSLAEVVTLSKPLLVDRSDATVMSMIVGEQVIIRSELKNNLQSSQPFVFIVHVKDSSHFTVMLSWMTGTLQADQKFVADKPWVPEECGLYTLKTFVWDDISTPKPLAQTVQSTLNVICEQIDTACKGIASCFEGIVSNIVDGDTIDVDGIRTRLALTNTPERGQPGYREATQFTASFCPVGSSVIVDEDDGQTSGSYGRIIAKMYCQGNALNSALLDAGLASIDTRFCTVSEFANEDWAEQYGC